MTISLQKGQKISLEKESGGALSLITMGLGWDAASGGLLGGLLGGNNSIDLDASCIMLDSAKNMVDSVWFKQLRSNDGSIVHTGDNRTGAGDGDDEQIVVDLTKIPETVQYLVFTVNNFTGQDFNKVENAFCRIVNGSNQQEIAKFDLKCKGSHSAMIMTKLYRHNGEWKMHALGEYASGRTFHDLLPAVTSCL